MFANSRVVIPFSFFTLGDLNLSNRQLALVAANKKQRSTCIQAVNQGKLIDLKGNEEIGVFTPPYFS